MSDKLSRDDEQDIKKLYELIALHELPYIKWIYKRTKQTTVIIWILLLLVLGSLGISAVTIILLVDF